MRLLLALTLSSSFVLAGAFLRGEASWFSRAVSAEPADPAAPRSDLVIEGKLWSEVAPSPASGVALTDLSDSMANLVSRVSPALVAIATRSKLSGELGAEHPEVETSGEGSGFIIHRSGLVVTNSHVIERASAVEVMLASGERVNAKILGSDRRSDLALLELTGGRRSYPVIPLGSSSDLRMGEIVLSCGNTFGLGTSIGLGILSGLKRNPGGDAGGVGGYLQTDAKIKPGNSGGPLLNSRGEVVGIASAVTGPRLDIGLAIPIDAAKTVLPFLYDRGYFPNGYLGIKLTTERVPSAQLRFFTKNGSSVDALRITEVIRGTGADRANLKPDDLIIRAGSREIRTVVDLQEAVGRLVVGESVMLALLRKGVLIEKTVEIAEIPESSERPRRRRE